MKSLILASLGSILIFSTLILSACQRQNTVCSSIEDTPETHPALADLIALPPPHPQTEPINIEIGGKMMSIDKYVDYPLCNDEWSGIVYVSCAAQVGEAESDAEDNPLFFKGCNLNIASGTIVYVAAHNDAVYYKGCSCHTGEDPVP